MEKFVLTQLKDFDKIAKYSPENAKIDLLVDADEQKAQLHNDNTIDPTTKSYLYALNLREIEANRKKVFPSEKAQAPINKSSQIEEKTAAETVEKESAQSVVQTEDAKPVDNEASTALNVSDSTQQRYENRQHMKELLQSVPNDDFYFDKEGNVYRDEQKLLNANIDSILNFLTTPKSQYVAGARTTMANLLNIPSFDHSMIENEKAWGAYKRAGNLKKIVIVDKLPFSINSK